ncbi:hypothetical protein [Micromonospora robiginosa]|uniref:Transmembrane transport protein n=1 Tax=Micromonospora robiginosa TaxID=2749844 RepID=A0A7L6B3R9_9ACTN|nr:hypothetical protein [Micromonospora ferruginea]QLQ36524.1 transmembrane transport protein [Micromonospora ferruginea]
MIWLTWRQFRTQAVVAVAALVVAAALLLWLGVSIRHAYDAVVACATPAACASTRDALLSRYGAPVAVAGIVLLALPAALGAFWGAPLLARELEAGTYRMVLTQGVTRTRWLLPKLVLTGLSAVVLTGTYSLLLTWAASRFDQVQGDRFTPLTFAARGLTPLGYALFAFLLGVAASLLLRRSVPAMAVTVAVVAAVGAAVPVLVRPHLASPITTTVAFTPDTVRRSQLNIATELQVGNYVLPGAWVLNRWHDLRDADGNKVTARAVDDCLGGTPEQAAPCLAGRSLHFEISYQPADRYWRFQVIELGGYLVLSALLAVAALRRMRRPLA